MKNKNIISDPEAYRHLQRKIDEIFLRELYHLSADEMVPEAEIIKDLGADSLDCQMIGFQIEDLFEIEIEDNDLEQLKTLADVYEYVAKKVEESNS